MKSLLAVRYTMLLSLAALLPNAYADLDVGKGTTTSTEIINEFKNNSSDDENTVDVEDATTRGMLCKSRGLASNCDLPSKPAVRKPKKPSKTGSSDQLPASSASTDRTSSCPEKGVSMEVLFDYNSDVLTDAAMAQLRPLGDALASPELSGSVYRVEGHTDAIGGDAYNKGLSLRRAEAVRNFLTQRFQFTGKSIVAIGKGKSNLADPANPASEKNRRVRIVKLGC